MSNKNTSVAFQPIQTECLIPQNLKQPFCPTGFASEFMQIPESLKYGGSKNAEVFSRISKKSGENAIKRKIQAKLFQFLGLKYQGLQSFFRLSMSVIVVLQNFLNLKVLLKTLLAQIYGNSVIFMK
ncbi:MAG: hypothetical protein E7052_11600 [Lentisphaerae bacterium]|nr:hypothetical protein [Lentisphaerota bacterium]